MQQMIPFGAQPFDNTKYHTPKYSQPLYTPQHFQALQDSKMRANLGNRYMDQLQPYLDKGKARGTELYGSIDQNRLTAERPEDVAGLIARYKRGSEEGLMGQDYAALRDRYNTDVNQQIGTMRQGQQARIANQGVRGAAAAGLSRMSDRDEYLQRLGAARDMRTTDLGFRTSQLDKYGQALGGALSREDDIKRGNLAGRMQAEMGYGQLGQAQMDRASRDMALANQQFQQQQQLQHQYEASKPKGKLG